MSSGHLENGGGAVAAAASAADSAVRDNWDEIDDSELTSKLQQLKTTAAASKTSSSRSNDTVDGTTTARSDSHDAAAGANSKQTTQQPTTTTTTPTPNVASSSMPSSATTRIGILPRPSHPAAAEELPSNNDIASPRLMADNSTSAFNTPTGGATVAIQLPSLLQKDDDYGGHQRPVILARNGANGSPAGTVAAVEPIVKILRRPEHHRTTPVVVERPKQPMKTLQQRKAEYAEARLRILGSAAAETASSEKGGENSCSGSGSASPQQSSPNNDSRIPSNNNYHNGGGGSGGNGGGRPTNQPHHNVHHQQHHHHHHHNQTQQHQHMTNGGGGAYGAHGAPSIRRPPLLAHAPPLMAMMNGMIGANGVVRQPRGPAEDMGGGFAFRR